MDAKTGNAKEETKLSGLIDRVGDMSQDLSSSRSNLNCLADRLLGSAPETACESDEQPVGAGIVGQLEDKINNLKFQINEMRDAVKRITSSGVI